MKRSVELVFEASYSLSMMGAFLWSRRMRCNVGQLTRQELFKWHAGLIFAMLFGFPFIMSWISDSTCQSPDIFHQQSFISGVAVQTISCIVCLHYIHLFFGISTTMISRQIS